MAAPTKPASVKKALANSEPSTHGTQSGHLGGGALTAARSCNKILSDVEDNRRWLRFRDAKANREPHKRDTPTTAKIYRPASYAAGSIYCARNVCFFTASGNAHLCISRLRSCYPVSNHSWHAHYF